MGSGDIRDVFGDVIFRYPRAEAIRDGVLIDVTETAQEMGMRYPVALTADAWTQRSRSNPRMKVCRMKPGGCGTCYGCFGHMLGRSRINRKSGSLCSYGRRDGNGK